MSTYRTVITAALLVLGAFPWLVNAALMVDFSATPLFAEANLLPGDAVSRTVTVTNTGPETETVEFDFKNIIPGPLASEMELVVDGGGVVHVDNAFATLFAEGPYPLGTLEANDSRTYTFTAALPPTVGDPLQAEIFGFDLLIGFTGDALVSDRARALTGGSRTLQLFNEAATVEESLGGAFVTWNSNRPASTYLVCGAVADGPFTLTEEAPLFGYQFALEEESETVVSHGMALSDLTPGEYECRPAGRTRTSAGFTVGDPVRFTVPSLPPGLVAGANTTADPAEIQRLLTAIIDEVHPRGSVLGMGGKGAGNLSYEEFRAEIDRLSAARTTTTTTINERLALHQAPKGPRNGEPTVAENPASWLTDAWWLLLLVILLSGGFLWRVSMKVDKY